MRTSDFEQKIDNAKDLEFGGIFNDSIELFKKTWVQGLVTLLLSVVLAIPVMMVFYIPLIFMGITDAYTNSYNAYDPYAQPDFSPIMIVVMGIMYIFLIVAMSAIGFGLKAGFYRICKLKDMEEIGKEDYFYFFKKPYLGKTIKLALATTGISILAALLCVIPLIYAIVPLSYMVIFYAFNPDMSISDIINLSFKLGNKKWLITFGLLFIGGMLAGIIGFLMCFVGVYVTASFSYLPPYLIYKDIIGFNSDSDHDSGDTLMDLDEKVTF